MASKTIKNKPDDKSIGRTIRKTLRGLTAPLRARRGGLAPTPATPTLRVIHGGHRRRYM